MRWTYKPGERKERKRFVIVIGLVDKPSGKAIGFLIATDAQLVESMPTVAQLLERIVEPSGSWMIAHSITGAIAQEKQQRTTIVVATLVVQPPTAALFHSSQTAHLVSLNN